MTQLFVKDLWGDYVVADTALVIAEAKRRLAAKFRRGAPLANPNLAREIVRFRIAALEYEVFMAILLDNQHRLIDAQELFRGTIDGASVYPREVVKAALAANAAAVIFAHNHPSGLTEPSAADRQITARLKAALNLVDIRVLDHFVVGADEIYSFAEQGIL